MFHSFNRLGKFMARLDETPFILRLLALLFMLPLAMLVEAVKVAMRKNTS